MKKWVGVIFVGREMSEGERKQRKKWRNREGKEERKNGEIERDGVGRVRRR